MAQGLIISSWSEITLRYPALDKLTAVSSSAVNSPANISSAQAALIADGEAFVHGRLAQNFDVPFSSNNYTAKDLVRDAIYALNIPQNQPVKGKTIADILEAKFVALCNGNRQMVTIAGTIAQAPTGDPVSSNMSGYNPIFSLNDEVMTIVDSAQLIDYNNLKGNPTEEAF